MKRPGNKTWLLTLMIISQIMLTVLVIQWLRAQWQDEREAFKRDIDQQFRESVNQVLDSMLIRHLIVPALNDSSVVHEQLIRFNKKIPAGDNKTDQHVTAFLNGNGEQKKTIVTISMADSSRHLQNEKIAFGSYDSAEKNLLLRSVKLIISQTGDSTGEWSQFRHMVSTVPDTTLLKRLFEDRFLKPGYNIDIRWIANSSQDKYEKINSILYCESYLFEEPFGAEIRQFRKILFKGISAQLLFTVVLLLVTGAAFIFTYRSLKKMETLNTLRDDFISNISHELKTPVSTVSVALEALKNYDRMKDPAKSGEYLDIASKEMNRLDKLINQVLNTSLLENQNQYIVLEETDLVSLSREVLDSMQVRFSLQKAVVDFKTDEAVFLLNLDRLHIQGVLINLLDNSLKYGVDNPEISVRIEQNRSSVLLTIRDNGQGIPDEYLKKVFDKFFRVPKGDKHNIKGYGLGLSFAYLVMKQHSGSIHVRNLKEGGCEFTLTFPKL